jgi:AcrR family transcriptional regulator
MAERAPKIPGPDDTGAKSQRGRAAARDGGDGRTARERLLASANELFYDEGVHTVGIDRIIEHAGVAKASLYNIFGSKERLVGAYLASHRDGMTERLMEAVERHRSPRKRLLAVFEAQGEIVAQPGFRGCAFVAATAEASHGGVIEQAADNYRAWIRALFTDLAEQAGAANPAELARRLQIIYDGTGLGARMDRDPSIAMSARAAAEALLDASL